MEKQKYHKKIRLEGEIYNITDIPCSITICTKDREDIFAKKKMAKAFLNLLREYSDKSEIPVYAYCIMPDHVHSLISASSKKGIVEFVREIKSLSTRLLWKYGYTGKIWQTSFYDHFLRKHEDLKTTARYIINNPVRAGLVERWDNYEFCGSWIFDL